MNFALDGAVFHWYDFFGMTKQQIVTLLKVLAKVTSIVCSGAAAGGVISGTLTTGHSVAVLAIGSFVRQIILGIGDIVDDGQENSSFNVNGNGSTFTGAAPTTIITPPKP